MKRTGIKRRTGRIQARKPLKKVNRKRAKERHEIAFGSKGAWIQTLPCVVAEWYGGDEADRCCMFTYAIADAFRSEAAHAKSRGAGGTSKDLVPMCQRHHREQHQIGIRSFEHKYGIDLKATAEGMENLWQQIEGLAA